MNNRFLNIFAFSPKIEWLNSGYYKNNFHDKASNLEWLWNTLPAYSPIIENYIEQIMVPEDLMEEMRLIQQGKAKVFDNIWLNRMVEIDNPLREKIALFWHHHIPSQRGRSFDQGILLIEIFRKHGLGKLKDLLMEIISTPATMHFLNLHISKKQNPNENFARELMELYVLGEGNYSLEDVKEVSRALTGRRFDRINYPYKYYLSRESFDSGKKTILGVTGNFDGEDVIDILLKSPKAAKHVTKSFLKFFFTDLPSEKLINDCSTIYYKSNYEMKTLINAIVSHEEFYKEVNCLTKVKTPVELLISLQRQTGLRTVGTKTNHTFLKLAGQVLFEPPNVAGWPGGLDWLNGDKLLHRLFLPSILLGFANRSISKSSIKFKIISRLSMGSLRKLRYSMDAKWDPDNFHQSLFRVNLSPSEWLIGSKAIEDDTKLILQNPDYQFV
jgi:uncharacterized protein (DUF1800 family)